MKNIHLLPTDKPSRLYKHLGRELRMTNSYHPQNGLICINQHIYITNSEVPKIGEWVIKISSIYKNGGQIQKYSFIDAQFKDITFEKIILTTDLDLIENGVQTIDDEFLEWFVKNPGCESVEIDLVPVNEFGSEITVGGYGFDKFIYKIIYKIIIPQSEPKQETLEEAAERIFREPFRKNLTLEEITIDGKDAVNCMLSLADWQAERSYSKEDMKQAFFDGIRVTGGGYNGEYASGNHPDIEVEFYESYIEWFKQFKKK